MNQNVIVKRRFGVNAARRRPSVAIPTATIPRVARLMALAIRFDQLIRDGVVADQAELARLGHVSRARLTQIVNLLNLAPDIQEDILLLPSIARGCHVISERDVRAIALMSDWQCQRKAWSELQRHCQ
jgi:hypothetical protein